VGWRGKGDSMEGERRNRERERERGRERERERGGEREREREKMREFVCVERGTTKSEASSSPTHSHQVASFSFYTAVTFPQPYMVTYTIQCGPPPSGGAGLVALQ